MSVIGGVLAVVAIASAGTPHAFAQPSNDHFSSATEIVVLPFEQSVSLNEATVEPDETLPSCTWGTVSSTVWYSFTPAVDGWVAAEVYSEDMFVFAAVWTGASLGDLAEVGCNDQSATQFISRVAFLATASVPYRLQVGRIDPDPVEEELPLPAPPEDDPAPVQFSLRPVGAIQGTVTNVSGAPIAHACVSVYAATEPEEWLDTAETDATGQYTAVVPGNGGYKAFFLDCSGDPQYVPEWYDDKPWSDTADTIEVVLGEATTGIDAVLDLGPDLVAQAMWIEDVPAAPDIDPDAGWERIVHVTVHNAGSVASPSTSGAVWTCAETTGQCREVGAVNTFGLEPGAWQDVEINWSGFGQLGDFTVMVTVSGPYPDPDWSNNSLQEQYSVLVGGLGAGVDATCAVLLCE